MPRIALPGSTLFTPLVADMRNLVSSSGFRIHPDLHTTYNVSAFSDVVVQTIKPRMVQGKWNVVWGLDSVRESMLNVLRKFARIVRNEMLRPTKHWIHKPTVHLGDPTKEGKSGIPVRLARSTSEVSTGAYVKAVGDHTEWEPSELFRDQTSDKTFVIWGDNPQGETKSTNADWHYIWLNNGTKERDIRARYQPTLTFMAGYEPSIPQDSKQLDGGFAMRSKPLVQGKTSVSNNYIHARNFTTTITEQQQPLFEKACLEAITKGIDKWFDRNEEAAHLRKSVVK